MNRLCAPTTTVSRAVLLMTASTLMFGTMAAVIRLASEQLHPFEIAFFRNFFGFVFALPLLLRHGPGLLKTSRLPAWPGPPSQAMSESVAKYVVVDKFANACAGTSTKEVIATAASQLKQIYTSN